MEVGVAAAPLQLLLVRIGEVVDEDLLRQRERGPGRRRVATRSGSEA